MKKKILLVEKENLVPGNNSYDVPGNNSYDFLQSTIYPQKKSMDLAKRLG